MIYEFECVQTDCKLDGVVQERNISSSQINEQTCEKCGEKLKRLWSFRGGISTGDGFKSSK